MEDLNNLLVSWEVSRRIMRAHTHTHARACVRAWTHTLADVLVSTCACRRMPSRFRQTSWTMRHAGNETSAVPTINALAPAPSTRDSDCPVSPSKPEGDSFDTEKVVSIFLFTLSVFLSHRCKQAYTHCTCSLSQSKMDG